MWSTVVCIDNITNSNQFMGHGDISWDWIRHSRGRSQKNFIKFVKFIKSESINDWLLQKTRIFTTSQMINEKSIYQTRKGHES